MNRTAIFIAAIICSTVIICSSIASCTITQYDYTADDVSIIYPD